MSRLFRRLFASTQSRTSARPKRKSLSPKARLFVRALEERLAPSTFTVTNTNDSGTGSFRSALTSAIASAGNTVGFSNSTAAGATNFYDGTQHTIGLLTALPTINNAVTITGPGSGVLTVDRDPSATASFGIFDFRAPSQAFAASGLTASGGTGTGITLEYGTLTLTNMAVVGNSASAGTGGGILAYTGTTLTIEQCTIAGNTAPEGGGIESGAALLIENSTISGNTATEGYTTNYANHAGFGKGGGGIEIGGTAATIRNSTIAGNSAASDGGGVNVENFSGTVLVQNCTITGNTAGTPIRIPPGEGGGGIAITSVASGGSVTLSLQSTIVAGNSARNGRPDLSATAGSVTVTANYSLLGAADTVTLSSSSGTNQAGTVAASLDPRLSALANNGGPTQTIAVHLNSPAIDHGSNPASLTTDQRGDARVVGTAADIGAFESDKVTPDATLTTAPNVTTAGGTTYQFTVTYEDTTAVNVSTLDSSDVTVTTPAGVPAVTVSFVSATPNSNAASIAATYHFTAPGGSWAAGDSGVYAVAVGSSQVLDTSSHPVPGGPIGSFQVVIAQILTVTNTSDTGTGSLRNALTVADATPTVPSVIQFSNTTAGGVTNFYDGTSRTITLASALPTISDNVNIMGPGAAFLAIQGAADPANPFRIFTADNQSSRLITLSGVTVSGGISYDAYLDHPGESGGGIYAGTGLFTLVNAVVSGNTALADIPFFDGGGGGGIGVGFGGSLVVQNSTVSGNSADWSGGGIYCFSDASLTLMNSTISGNTSNGSITFAGQTFESAGGGVYFCGVVSVGGFTISNTTISGNTARAGGGVGLAVFAGTLTVQNSTIANNTATANSAPTGLVAGGGGIDLQNLDSSEYSAATGTILLQSTIVAANTGPLSAQTGSQINPDIGAPTATNVTITATFSLIGAADAVTLSGSSANNQTGTVASPLDPMLGALQNNGGPTKTQALLSGSPAIDAGSNPAALVYDQRGFPFIRTYQSTTGTLPSGYDGTDIGAYEVLPSTTVVYADTHWQGSGYPNGTNIGDADPIITGSQPGIVGYDAFPSVNQAIAAAAVLFAANPSAGVIVVNGYDGSTSGSGVFNEAVVDNGAVPMYLQPGAVGVAGAVTFNSLAGNNTVTTIGLHGVNLTTGGDNTNTEYDGTLTGSGTATNTVTEAGHGTGSPPDPTIGVMTFGGTASHVTLSGTSTAGTGKFATKAGGTVHFTVVTITSSGSVTVGAVGTLDVDTFSSYGTLTLLPAVVGSGQSTLLKNVGTADTPASKLYFGNGSKTYIGTPGTANSGGSPTFVAGIDLNDNDAFITGTSTSSGSPPVYTPGALFVNNGFVVDSSTNSDGSTDGDGAVIVDGAANGTATSHGALYKGAGYTGVNVITQNGGYVQAGNSPGTNHLSRFVFGPAGVSNYLFQIDDATGVAGPTPDAAGHVDGWSLVNAGDFTWTADSTHKLSVAVQSLINPTSVGTDPTGTFDNFDPTQSYVWEAVKWTGTYTGPTDAAALNAATTFDTSAVVNAAGGKFIWQLDTAAQTLSLVYTPPPAVAAVQLNDSGSGVQSMTVTFSTAVSFAGGNAAAAFRLTNVDTGAAVTLSAVVSTDSLGRTVVTLTFSGDQTNSLDALLSGRYALTIVGSAVTGTNGVALDGSGTGTGNGIDFTGQTWTV
jgi:hypothetical protein